MVHIGNDWDDLLKEEFEKPYYRQLHDFLKEEYRTHTVYPGMYDIFNALKYTSFADTKVVIIGQDPYHEPGQAQGLCFSVNRGVPIPPSLKNIYQELQDDIGFSPVSHGDLTSWAKQGILLLNSVLTVRRGQANSHKGKGWETFTDCIVSHLDQKQTPVVFLLWGAPARKKAECIRNPLHVRLTAAHPSPLSAYHGFFGCRHFSETNRILAENGLKPIDWQLPE